MEKNEKAFESFLQVCTVVKDANIGVQGVQTR